MKELAYIVRVFGIVQGVGFRYFTREQALQLRLRGHAYNLIDGSVEVCICGTPNEIEQMLGWLERGPRTAKVTRIEITPCEIITACGFHTN